MKMESLLKMMNSTVTYLESSSDEKCYENNKKHGCEKSEMFYLKFVHLITFRNQLTVGTGLPEDLHSRFTVLPCLADTKP